MVSSNPSFYCQPNENDSPEIALLKKWLESCIGGYVQHNTNFIETLTILIEHHYEEMANLSTQDLDN